MENDATVQPKNAPAINKKIRVLSALMDMVLKKRFGIDERDSYAFVYDCGSALYTTVQLDSKGPISVEMLPDELRPDQIQYFGGKRLQHVTITLTLVQTIGLREAVDRLATDAATYNPRDVCAFLDVVSNASMIKNAEYHVIRNAMFHRETDSDMSIDQGLCVRAGFEKSVKIAEVEGRPQFVLSFVAVNKPFYKELSVVDFLAYKLECRRPEDIERTLGRDFKFASAKVKGVLVSTTHLEGEQKEFFIHSLHKQSANTEFIEDLRKSVAEYFMDKYHRRLQYPNLPLICDKRGKNYTFYPAEVLKVSRLQTVRVENLGNKQANVVEKTRLRPDQQVQYVRDALARSGLDRGTPYLAAFGVSIQSRPLEAKAVVLKRPTFVLGRNVTNEAGCDNDYRTMKDYFYVAARRIKPAVINYDHVARSEDQLRTLWEAIVTAGNGRGMKFDPERYFNWNTMSDEEVISKLRDLKAEGYNFVFLVNKEKTTSIIHYQLKRAEQEVGICTQDVAASTACLGKGTPGAMTMFNLLVKMNQKMGGINYTLKITPNMTFSGMDANNLTEKYFSKSRMYVGLDLSHAGAQSMYDQQSKTEVRQPSIVGLCFTTVEPTAMRGSYFAQAPRLTKIQNLRKQFRGALEEFKRETGAYPREIVVFRGGLSEGEMDPFVETEVEGVDGMLAACDDCGITPNFYAIIVQMNCNVKVTRTNVQRGQPAQCNVPPGTSLNEAVVNPQRVEVVLISQKGMIGTSRPTRCTLIYQRAPKQDRMNNEILRFVANSLCYAHGVSSCPTGIPAPLYGASNLAKRGAAVLRQLNNGCSDTMSMVSGGSTGSANEEQSALFYDKVTHDLRVSLETVQFWA